MTVKSMLVVTVPIFIFLLVSNETGADDKVFPDQIQGSDIGEFSVVNSKYIVGQTFEVNTNGFISSLLLKLDKTAGSTSDGQPGYAQDLVVEIRTSIGDLVPSEEVLASVTVSESDIEEGTPQWYEITFSTKPYVFKKSRYSLVLKTVGDESSKGSYSIFYFGSDDVDAYEKGMMLIRKADDYYFNWIKPITWQYYDAAFELYMTKGK